MKKVLVPFLLLFLLVSTSYGNTGIGLGLDLGLGSGSSFMPMVQYLFIDDLADTKGIQADFTASRDTMMSYIDPNDSLLKMAHADRTQLFDTPGVPITQDITVEANKSYVGSYGSGGSIAFADNTSTSTQISVDDSGSVYITVTGAGDVTATVTGSPSYGMLEEVPSDLALGPDLTVVGITSANPGVVTITGHGLLTGDYVQFKSLTEMTELNGTTQKITKLGADTFSIIDTSTYAAETTGGSCANKIPAATMYAALGPELVTNGDFATGDLTGWTDTNTFWTVSGGKAVHASSSAFNTLLTTGIPSVGSMALITFTVSDYVGSGVGSGDIRVQFRTAGNTALTGAFGTNGGGAVCGANGTYQAIIEVPATAVYLAFARDTSEISFAIDDVSVKELGQFITPSDYINASSIPAEPRFEADGMAFLGASVLNLLSYSEDIANTFSNGSATYTEKDAISPDGYSYADKITVSGQTGYKRTESAITVLPETNYTLSVFINPDANMLEYKLRVYDVTGSAEIVATSVMSQLTTGVWKRAFITFTTPAGCVAIYPYVGYLFTDGASAHVWGINLTETAFLAPYIPSHGAPTYTGPETVTATLSAALKNILSDAEGAATSEGTMVVEWTPGIDGDQYTASKSIVACQDGIGSLIYANTDQFRSLDSAANVSAVVSDFAAGDTLTLAVFWEKLTPEILSGAKINSGAWAWDGVTQNYSGAFTLGTKLNIGYAHPYPFHIKDLRFYKRALTTDQIEEKF